MNWYKKSNNINEKKLYILRAISGTGKSTLAQKLSQGGVVLSSDDYFMKDGKYIFDASKLGEANQWNQERAKQALSQGISPVVIDNTNRKVKEVFPYYKMGKDFGYKIELVEPNWHPNLKTPEGKWNIDFIMGLQKNKDRANIGKVLPREVVERMANDYEYNLTEEDILNTKSPYKK